MPLPPPSLLERGASGASDAALLAAAVWLIPRTAASSASSTDTAGCVNLMEMKRFAAVAVEVDVTGGSGGLRSEGSGTTWFDLGEYTALGDCCMTMEWYRVDQTNRRKPQ